MVKRSRGGVDANEDDPQTSGENTVGQEPVSEDDSLPDVDVSAVGGVEENETMDISDGQFYSLAYRKTRGFRVRTS